jgi:chromosome segregation and condensation protein ScpB
MSTDPTDWHQALAHVTGALVCGDQRVSTQELFAKLGVPVTDAACRRLKRVMHDLGWRGPKLMRWGEETTRGYWRHPTVGLPAIPASARMQKEPVVEIETTGEGSLAAELEEVTRLALQKLDQILRLPTDRGDGNLLRAQTAAAGIAVNAQLRADETRLRQKTRGDVLERLSKLIEEERKKLPPDHPGSQVEGNTLKQLGE